MGEMIQVFPHLERDKTQLKGVLLRGKDVVVFFLSFFNWVITLGSFLASDRSLYAVVTLA